MNIPATELSDIYFLSNEEGLLVKLQKKVMKNATKFKN